jgi:hypothetical protein
MRVIEYVFSCRDGTFHGIVKEDTTDNDYFHHQWRFIKVFENTIPWHEPISLIDEEFCIIKEFSSSEYPEYFI